MYLRARCLLAALGLGFGIDGLVRRNWEIGNIYNDIYHIETQHDITCAKVTTHFITSFL